LRQIEPEEILEMRPVLGGMVLEEIGGDTWQLREVGSFYIPPAHGVEASYS
jgi:hypothetical protein